MSAELVVRDGDGKLVYRLTLPVDPIADPAYFMALVAGQQVTAIACERSGNAQVFCAKTLEELRTWAAGCDLARDEGWPELSPARWARSLGLKLLDDLIRAQQERLRDRETEGFGGLEVDDHLKLGGLLDGQVGRLCPLEDLIHEDHRLPRDVGPGNSVA